MAFDTDIRQAVVLALQTEGADLASQLVQVLRNIGEIQRTVTAQWEQGAISGAKFTDTMKSLTDLGDKWRKTLHGIRDEEKNADLAGFEKVDVSLNQLIVSGLKFQAVLDKIGAKDEAAEGRAQQLRDEAALQEYLGLKTKEAGEAAAQGQRATAAARRLGTDAIADHVAGMQRERDATEAARVADIKAMGDRARAHAREEQDLEGLRAQIAKTTTAMERETAAEVWAARQTADRDAAFRGMLETEQTATTIVSANTDAVTRQGVALKDAAARAQGFSSHAELAANQTKKMSQFAMNASYAFQDMQYGIGAVANNVGLLATSASNAFPKVDKFMASLGGTAMVGAGVMSIAVAADLLYTHWDKIANAFSIGIPRPILDTTEDLKRKLDAASKITDDLGKKTRLSLSEYDQYGKATDDVKKLNEQLKQRQELEDALKSTSKSQREHASAFKEALGETGGGAALDSLDTAIGQTADAKGMVFNEYTGKNSKPRQLAEDLIRTAASGDTRARDEVLRFLGAAYKEQKGDFASNIKAASPETKARQKDDEDDAKAEAHYWEVEDRTNASRSTAWAKLDADAKKRQAYIDEEVEFASGMHDTDSQHAEKDKAAKVKEAADSVQKGFVARAAKEYAQNDLAIAQGLPVSRGATEEKKFRAFGQPYALPPQVLGGRIEKAIGRDLRRTGMDAGLAGPVATELRNRAGDHYDALKTQAMASTPMPDASAAVANYGQQAGTAMAQMAQSQAVIATVLGGLTSQVMQAQQTSARAMQTALGVGGQAAQMRTRGPSASPLVRRGM